MNWLLIGLIVFVAFSWLMTLALCRAARLGDEQAARLADERRAAQRREEGRP
ncbi:MULTISPECIES: hypothetical protein [Bifidobacterium]|uniref:hypothetical protein n=1 Tax=Bifidobacterium TaxID=1678 RepID=UPI0015694EFD|nr:MULTISPECIES: hypothetical protein [Bifidobacterium]